MQHLEGDEFYEKISHYLKTISNTELSVVSSMHESFSQLLKESSRISRLYNYECYTKVCPSLGQHITYVKMHVFCRGSTVIHFIIRQV